MISLQTYCLLCVLSFVAGAINSIAGGGTLLTFPALYAAFGSTAAGAVLANGTNTVALFPGALASMGGYRKDLEGQGRWAVLLMIPSLIGGVIGSLLAVLFPDSFRALVPWLILTAAMLFALQPQISRLTGIGQPHPAPSSRTALGTALFQLAVAVYGGYFGAGIGILMLTALAMMGMSDIHRMNALKSVLGSVINGVAAIVFIATGQVHWPMALAMGASAIVGGYLGAVGARRVERRIVRLIVTLIGFSLAAYYFYRAR